MTPSEQMTEAARSFSTTVKSIFDGFSISVALGALIGYLPALAAAASLVWSLIRIYETKTVQRWLKK